MNLTKPSKLVWNSGEAMLLIGMMLPECDFSNWLLHMASHRYGFDSYAHWVQHYNDVMEGREDKEELQKKLHLPDDTKYAATVIAVMLLIAILLATFILPYVYVETQVITGK